MRTEWKKRPIGLLKLPGDAERAMHKRGIEVLSDLADASAPLVASTMSIVRDGAHWLHQAWARHFLPTPGWARTLCPGFDYQNVRVFGDACAEGFDAITTVYSPPEFWMLDRAIWSLQQGRIRWCLCMEGRGYVLLRFHPSPLVNAEIYE